MLTYTEAKSKERKKDFFFIIDEMNKGNTERPEIKSIDIILTLHCTVLIGNLFISFSDTIKSKAKQRQDT